MDFVEIIRSQTFRHTGLVTFATVINGILGFIFFFLMARVFNATQLGLFSVAVTASGLIADIAAVGTDTGNVNFVGRFIKKDKEKAYRFLKVALETKIVVSVFVLIFGFLLAPFAANLLGNKNLTPYLQLSLFITVGLLLFNFAASSLQALQKFVYWGGINISSNLLRLIFVGVLLSFGILNVQSGILLQFFGPLILFTVSLFLLPNFLKVKNEKKVLHDFFNYNKWVAIFTVIAALASRLDTFFVTRFAGIAAVGIYSIAVTLTSVVPQLVGAIGTVVAPKFASQTDKKSVISYLKKLQLFVCGLAMIGIIFGGLIGYFFIKHFYRPEYLGSYLPFLILLSAQAIFLFSIPVHMATIYYFSYPKLFVLISLVNLVIVVIFCLILVPIWGINGAAISILVGNISNFIIPAIWVTKKFKQ